MIPISGELYRVFLMCFRDKFECDSWEIIDSDNHVFNHGQLVTMAREQALKLHENAEHLDLVHDHVIAALGVDETRETRHQSCQLKQQCQNMR